MAAKKRQANPLAGKIATVHAQMNGFAITIEGVAAESSGDVLAGVLSAFQQLKREFPDELLPDLEPVGGGFPVPVAEFWEEDGRKGTRAVGFRLAAPNTPAETERP